ncbi:MAG: tetratricopeptide repeat protein [Planctomycetes bacterium]|nr:tetratricopeptide repeat protein [Planctomycetota bacterium]
MSTGPDLSAFVLLMEHRRYDLAETELRKAAATDPNNAQVHALLAMCMAARGNLKAADAASRQAVALAPDSPFSHYARARVLEDRDEYGGALKHAREALRLDPANSLSHAIIARVHLVRKTWAGAIATAEAGLAVDVECAECHAVRGMALVFSGRKHEAEQAAAGVLARDPENSLAHATMGWALLDKHDYARAFDHFRESLRIDPGNVWARDGVTEAMRARNVLYRPFLWYFRAMSRLSGSAQWGVILGLWVAAKIVHRIPRIAPSLTVPVYVLLGAYFVFIMTTWIAEPLADLVVRLDRFGRLSLDREKIVASNWIGALLLIAVASFAAWLATGALPALLAGCASVLLLPSVASVFSRSRGAGRVTMTLFTIALALLGALGVGLSFADGPDATFDDMGRGTGVCVGLFILGAVGATWVANIVRGVAKG